MPFVIGGGGISAGGGGLHFRDMPDVFINVAARTAWFGKAANAAVYLEFANDKSLAIIIGTISNATGFQTYVGDAAAVYDDANWLDRTDAVQSTTPGPLPSDGDIKTGYERNPDTNEFSDADKTKLTGIEPGAQVNVGVAYTQSDKTKLTGIAPGAQVNVGVAYTQAEKTKLSGSESRATADQTAQEISAALDVFLGNALWRTRLSGSALTAAIDAAVRSDVWRTDHTALRSAQAIVALLDAHFGGTDWRTGGGGGGGVPLAQVLTAIIAGDGVAIDRDTDGEITISESARYRPIFDVFTGAGTGSIRAHYGAADLSWTVRSIERQVLKLASALLSITGSADAGWQVTFKANSPQAGAAGTLYQASHIQRAAAVVGARAQVMLYGNRILLRYNEDGADNNGNRIGISISSGSIAFSYSKNDDGNMELGHGGDLTLQQVVDDINGIKDTDHYNFTASLVGEEGTNAVGSEGVTTSYVTAGGATETPSEPISISIDATAHIIIFHIDSSDTLTEIRSAPTFSDLTAIADVDIVGIVTEGTDTLDQALLDNGINFLGGVNAKMISAVADVPTKQITVTYAETDIAGDLFQVLTEAQMSPTYRGALATQSLETPGWTRLIGPATTGNGRFVGLSDTPEVILPRRVVSGNQTGDALEFIRQVTSPAGIPRVSKIPSSYTDAVLYLPTDEQTFSGRRLDRNVTPGFDLPDFYGFSDGEAQPATGSVAGGSDHLSWIGGPIGSRDANGAVTSWQPDYLASHARDWIAQWDRVTLNNVQYDIGGQYWQGGIWLTAIVDPPTFTTGAPVAMNYLRNDNTALWTNQQVVTRLAGLYWWNPDASPERYQHLEADGIFYRGVHALANVYQAGDLVSTAAGDAFLAIKSVPANTALSDKASWFSWKSAAPITVSTVLPAVADVPRNTMAAVGAAAATGLTTPPHYRRTEPRDAVIFRVDSLGAGRVGFSNRILSDHSFLGKSAAPGGSITPAISGLLGLYEQPRVGGGTTLQMESSLATDSVLGAVTGNLRISISNSEISVSHVGVSQGRRIWVAAKTVGPMFLKAGTVNSLKIINATTNSLYNLHAGDYLSPFTDRVLIDGDIANVERRLLQVGENRQDIVSLESDTVPTFNMLNYESLHIDHRSPRSWVGQRYPVSTTPATANSAFTLVTGHWLGTYSIDPTTAVENDVYYNRHNHTFRKYVSAEWVSGGFSYYSAFFFQPSHWLGERRDSNDAANYIVPPIGTDNYFFYHKGDGRVEQITNSTYNAPTGLTYRYAPHALVHADDIRKELLADHTLYTDKNATGMHISPTQWIVGAKIDFSRALTVADDDRIIACHLRWEERNPIDPTSKTQGHHRSFSAQIDGLTFRTLGERVSGVNGNSNSMTESADWYVRQPNWRPSGNFNTSAEMRISYGRERLSNGRDAIRFMLAAGDTQTRWAGNTRIFNFQGRFVLHH